MDEIARLTDTELETNNVQEEEEGEEKMLQKVTENVTVNNGRRSLYDISFDNSLKKKHESLEFKDYERRLHQEMKDWKAVLFKAYNDLKQSKQKHPIVDKTILTRDKLEYLEKAQCMQTFVRESVEFRQQAVLLLEHQYAEYMDMVENLETMVEHKLNLIKAFKIAENLANDNKPSD